MGTVVAEPDRADLAAGDMPPAAQQRQQPARIGILAATDVHLEPDRVLEAGARSTIALRRRGRSVDQLFGRGHLRTVRLDQHDREVLGAALGEQRLGEFAIGVLGLDRRAQPLEQALAIGPVDVLGRGRVDPLRRDVRAAQHLLEAAAARVGHDHQCGALLARTARAARTVLERIGIARQLDMDHQRQAGQVDAASGDVGRHADACAAVAQRLQRLVALVLAVLARQRDGGKAALDQARMQVAHVVARRAEQDRGFRLVQPQQVDHGILGVRRRDSAGDIVDIAMAALFADGRDAVRIALITLGQRDDRLGHGGREQQGAAAFWRCVENFLEVLAKAHVEHLVGLVEHCNLERRKVERTALEMVAQTARRADHDLRAIAEVAPLARGVHAADTGRDARAGGAIEPHEFAADLQRQFARRRDDQRLRGRSLHDPPVFADQLGGHRQAEGDGLARSGLRRDDQVAALRLGLQHGLLDGGERVIAVRVERVRQNGGNGIKRHGISIRVEDAKAPHLRRNRARGPKSGIAASLRP